MALAVLLVAGANFASAQLQWTSDGTGFYSFSEDGIEIINPVQPEKNVNFLTAKELIPAGTSTALRVQSFQVAPGGRALLLFANTQRVWRERTRGDYWLFDQQTKTLTQLGKGLPTASLMFAKFSPDGTRVAYVSKHNIYVEELKSHVIKQITTDGTDRIINGTFDWAYEEEFGTQDGFRWSPDGTKIAFWKQDARQTRNFLMINNTDSTYAFTIPVEYPKVGFPPSPTRIWVHDLTKDRAIQVEDLLTTNDGYIPRMEWLTDGKGLIFQTLNRKQNESNIITSDLISGKSNIIHSERDEAWIDIKSRWNDGDPAGWDWLNDGKTFIWVSEKGGWRQIYTIDLTGKERLITKEPFDVIQIDFFDSKTQTIYYSASPTNATQKYLYKVSLKGGKSSRVTPGNISGTNTYTISPNGKIALFNHSSTTSWAANAVVSLPDHKELVPAPQKANASAQDNKTEFFQVTTADGVTLDGWMVKPKNFDPAKKYPVVFYVYGEPASQTVTDAFGTGKNRLYMGDMAADGYVYISLENRGAPAPKGRTWRKSIYRNIGILNIRDQAMGAKEVFKWGFIDTARVAVWGWSGGGASTLNLLGQYPEIYKTGISIAPVTNQLLYDNIYQERYMGLPQENEADFLKGSAISYAKNVKGNLLLVHGTGDDNVHYQNAEVYINELIKYNIPFQMMSYPNRSHSISEGEGTSKHLSLIYTRFLRENCPPGAQ
ncbi:DPP IV N-terminal domain-containing protein [Sphingobacterium oryzagri]|uniref:DPP IV N-terminal domain-containing protein n=2 Tax=Sphingobacterium oryzagri TaxID=3025669 RepID=A0ABY7WC03_9SPHI|nr:DPP IV N-terminal domain-containing protein [Sphingobacterium sp. KACC 22765]WDF67174.1 DPP IV N-terminal domain-containing protein [Sphingobacterium sp. KACC 22765]